MKHTLRILKTILTKIIKFILSNYHLRNLVEQFIKYIPWLKLRLRQLLLSENEFTLNNQVRHPEDLSLRATKILSDLQKVIIINQK